MSFCFNCFQLWSLPISTCLQKTRTAMNTNAILFTACLVSTFFCFFRIMSCSTTMRFHFLCFPMNFNNQNFMSTHDIGLNLNLIRFFLANKRYFLWKSICNFYVGRKKWHFYQKIFLNAIFYWKSSSLFFGLTNNVFIDLQICDIRESPPDFVVKIFNIDEKQNVLKMTQNY